MMGSKLKRKVELELDALETSVYTYRQQIDIDKKEHRVTSIVNSDKLKAKARKIKTNDIVK